MTTLPSNTEVHDLIQLARESLRIVDELHRAGVPVSATTHNALLNEAVIAIEAVRSTLGPNESLAETFHRLAPWARATTPPVLPGPPREEPPAAKRTRRTKTEMEADAAAKAQPTADLPPLALVEDRTPDQLAADGDGPAVAITNPMPVEAATVIPGAPTAGVPVAVPDSAQPGFDREKAEATLKKTGDEFRAAEARRLEREAQAVAAQVKPAESATTPAPAENGQTPYADRKEKLRLAPLPEDMPLPWKNGEYAGKKFSDCTIRDLEIIMANYVKGVESEPDLDKRAARSIWLERSSAWHRYRFDLLLVNAGAIDLGEIQAEYKEKASSQGPSASMQMHRKRWFERVLEVALARESAGA